MNLKFHTIYTPLTSVPFDRNETYMEFAPCDALKPFIKCFWGTSRPIVNKVTDSLMERIVTPDTCMDIIFKVNYTDNIITSRFYGIDDRAFPAYKNVVPDICVSTFAIRFYPWSAVLFSEESMGGVLNGFFDAGYHFSKLKNELEQLLFDITDIESRIVLAEKYLLENIHPERMNPLIMQAVNEILADRGNIRTEHLAAVLAVSTRHLERLFSEYMGISPKKFSSLVRYQYLWKDILFDSKFHILDAVQRYGYTDQPHLLREFKKYHTVTIGEAKRIAFRNVAFLQDRLYQPM